MILSPVTSAALALDSSPAEQIADNSNRVLLLCIRTRSVFWLLVMDGSLLRRMAQFIGLSRSDWFLLY
jgi:hypothetical protein